MKRVGKVNGNAGSAVVFLVGLIVNDLKNLVRSVSNKRELISRVTELLEACCCVGNSFAFACRTGKRADYNGELAAIVEDSVVLKVDRSILFSDLLASAIRADDILVIAVCDPLAVVVFSFYVVIAVVITTVSLTLVVSDTFLGAGGIGSNNAGIHIVTESCKSYVKVKGLIILRIGVSAKTCVFTISFGYNGVCVILCIELRKLK